MRNSRRQFPPGVADILQGYVYTLHDPRETNSSRPFYIGKGESNNRVFDHFFEADVALQSLGNANSSPSDKVRRILDIWDAGLDVSVFVHRHGLKTDQVMEVEASLIEAFPDALNEIEGHHTSQRGRIHLDDLCSKLAPTLAIVDFPAIAIIIRSEWPWVREVRGQHTLYQDRLYSATRAAWPISLDRAARAPIVLSVADRLVRQVYRVPENGWKVADIDSRGRSRPLDKRKMFEGTVADEFAHLIGKSVPEEWFGGGRQFPVRYLNV